MARTTISHLAIIVIPLQKILDNIYTLLSRPPTCQSRLSCVSVRPTQARNDTQQLQSMECFHNSQVTHRNLLYVETRRN